MISYGLSFLGFARSPEFRTSKARSMTSSAVHKLSEYCVHNMLYGRYQTDVNSFERFLTSFQYSRLPLNSSNDLIIK